MWFALLIACSETGLQNFSVHDAWQSPEEGIKADILFVVDDSASMAEEQSRLADNFEAFVRVLDGSRADWRLGITTTDATGEFRGGILKPNQGDLQAAFEEGVKVGTNGNRNEQGFLSAAMAIASNPDFIRKDADLHLVFVSDEDDHSPEPMDFYRESLIENSGTGVAAFHALVGDLPEGCASGSLAAGPGTRYLEAAAATGGLTESICAEDYSPILTHVGLEVAGWQSVFALSNLAAPESLVVKVDGVTIPQRETDGWTYSLGDNAVVFTGRAVPRPGMWIEADYTRWLGGDQR